MLKPMRKELSPSLKSWLVCAGLAMMTLALYWPAVHHGFVDYDDQQYVTENPRVRAGLTWNGLAWAFGFHAGNWHPLAWLSHMFDCQFYGLNAAGHHFTNILLHVAGTLLLFLALDAMTKAFWRSAAVAALFAWHPLHVESVAWVAERKDLLCGFFWMLTLLLYARHVARRSPARYLSVLVAFALCLMSKPMGVTLPFVLLLLDYWPLKRLPLGPFRLENLKPLVIEKIPLLAMSAAVCALTLQAQKLAIVSTAGLPLAERVFHAVAAYNHYLVAMFFPRGLAVYYPYQASLPTPVVAVAITVTGLITLLAVMQVRQRPYLAVGWFWYLGTLVPVIGLVQVGDQAWADRYTYLPLIGLFIAVIWLAGEVIKSRTVAWTLAGVIGVALMAATEAQLGCWRNTRTLFERANRVTKNNYMAITILGSELAKDGKLEEAKGYYKTALRLNPNFPEAHFYLGNALDQEGRLDEAVAEYKKALWFQPTQAQTHIFLGMALAREKKYDAAIENYEAALKLDPDSAVAENNLARIYQTLNQFDAAIAHYQAALGIDPTLAIAHNNLGILMIQNGNVSEGIRQLREALKLKPDHAETEYNLAQALTQQGRWVEAAGLFAKTIGGHPNDPNAHYEFALALGHLQQTREAMSEYARALLLRPDFPDALDGLAWILSTDPRPEFRNGVEAVTMAERACALTGQQDPARLKTLAAAYAEAGRFGEAVKTSQTAKALADKTGRRPLAEECSKMLEQFQHSRSWRGP